MSKPSSAESYEKAMTSVCFGPDASPNAKYDTRAQEVYRTLVRNNVRSIIHRAVPLALRHLGEKEINGYIDAYLATSPPTESFFRDIPQGFAAWLELGGDGGPTSVSVKELLLWEILEMAVLFAPDADQLIDDDDGFTTELHPSTRLTVVQYPVHKVTQKTPWPPKPTSIPSAILAYRRSEKMEHREISHGVAHLLNQIATSGSFQKALAACNEILPAPLSSAFARAQLMDFYHRGALTSLDLEN